MEKQTISQENQIIFEDDSITIYKTKLIYKGEIIYYKNIIDKEIKVTKRLFTFGIVLLITGSLMVLVPTLGLPIPYINNGIYYFAVKNSGFFLISLSISWFWWVVKKNYTLQIKTVTENITLVKSKDKDYIERIYSFICIDEVEKSKLFYEEEKEETNEISTGFVNVFFIITFIFCAFYALYDIFLAKYL